MLDLHIAVDGELDRGELGSASRTAKEPVVTIFVRATDAAAMADFAKLWADAVLPAVAAAQDGSAPVPAAEDEGGAVVLAPAPAPADNFEAPYTGAVRALTRYATSGEKFFILLACCGLGFNAGAISQVTRRPTLPDTAALLLQQPPLLPTLRPHRWVFHQSGEGWHVSCEHEDVGKAGAFTVERLNGPAYRAMFCLYKQAQSAVAGPLAEVVRGLPRCRPCPCTRRSRPSPRGWWCTCCRRTSTKRRTPPGRSSFGAASSVRDPKTWTILQRDGPNHLGLRHNALPAHQMALITSDCAPSSRHPALLLLHLGADGRGARRSLPAAVLQGDAAAGPGVVWPPAHLAPGWRTAQSHWLCWRDHLLRHGRFTAFACGITFSSMSDSLPLLAGSLSKVWALRCLCMRDHLLKHGRSAAFACGITF